MTNVKYLILGGGPAGLTFANLLKRKGFNDFLLLEAENEAGGLCRSKDVDGSPLDIAGGHFLDVRRPKVNEFLFSFMPENEWNLYKRDSRIQMDGFEIGHPFEANIWQMPQSEQVEYLKSIAVAGCNLGEEMPTRFVEWIQWKLGKKIAEAYMLPYNGKMFGGELDSLGTYWLNKLPNVSFDETLLSCLNKQPYGTQPGHAEFYYPKHYGIGELFKRMGEALGDNICYEKRIVSLDVKEKEVTCSDGSVYKADVIISTIPWTSIKQFINCDEEISKSVKKLKHTGTEIKYVGENLDTKAHWIYVPSPEKSYHRILVRHNFCEGSKGYWLETNLNRVDEKVGDGPAFANEYTYPLNTVDKPQVMKELLSYMKANNIYGLGRWGEHEHYNSDATVERSMNLFDELYKG